MPLIDDLQFDPSDEELARRKFLGLAGSDALAVIGAGTAITTVRFLEPAVLYEVSSRFRVGRPDDITPGTLLVLEKQKTYVLRTGMGFVAFSSVCTHLGCMTRYEASANRIFCPCHGSEFSASSGTVTGGPAPKALVRLELVLEKGFLWVDTKSEVSDREVLEV